MLFVQVGSSGHWQSWFLYRVKALEDKPGNGKEFKTTDLIINLSQR